MYVNGSNLVMGFERKREEDDGALVVAWNVQDKILGAGWESASGNFSR
jgi:hypothetical protein